MTIENRDMHTYNCDVYITHGDNVYKVPITNGLEISLERKGSAGKCTFSVIQEEDGEIQFEEGDTVRVRISKTWMFYGFIFTLSRSKDRVVKITCYDQLRYLKAKESAIFVNKSVGEIVTMIANDRRLNMGAIRDSKYKIPSITKENSTYFDMIMTAIEKTTEATGEIFILYDNFGKLTLCPLKHMYRNVIIDASVIGDFDYESTIDRQTYNVIRVGYKSQKDGATVYQTWKDEKSIAKWGMLQLTEKANSSFSAVTVGTQLLKMFNSKTKTLKIKNAMGANEVVAGAVIVVNLDLGDMVISNNMVVDAVTHRIEDGLYSMDLELIGGEFVSTRGTTSDQATNSNSGSGKQTSISRIGAKDWGHGVTAAMMNKVLKGPLAGMGEKFVQLGNAFGVNPMLVAMMIRIESRPSMNSGLALKGNNFGGITYSNRKDNYAYQHYGKIWMGDRYYVKFPSVDAGVEYQFYLLAKHYIRSGKRTIRDIIMTYAPPYENDSTGYINSLKSFYKQNTGVTWNEGLLGSGVSSMEEGRQNMSVRSMSSIGNYENPTDANAIIEHAIKFCMDRLGTPYSQADKLRNSYKYKNGNPTHFDCSAMVYYAYADAGKLNKRPANAWTTASIDSNPGSYGLKYIPIANAKRGDILWMRGHLGLYLGNGRAVESTPPRSQTCPSRKFTRAYRFSDF